jgi:hypothetical protein
MRREPESVFLVAVPAGARVSIVVELPEQPSGAHAEVIDATPPRAKALPKLRLLRAAKRVA